MVNIPDPSRVFRESPMNLLQITVTLHMTGKRSLSSVCADKTQLVTVADAATGCLQLREDRGEVGQNTQLHSSQ